MSLEKEEKDKCLIEFERLLNQTNPYNQEVQNLLSIADDIDPDLHDICSFSLWIKKVDPQTKFDFIPKEVKDKELVVISPAVFKAFMLITLGILVVTAFALGN